MGKIHWRVKKKEKENGTEVRIKILTTFFLYSGSELSKKEVATEAKLLEATTTSFLMASDLFYAFDKFLN